MSLANTSLNEYYNYQKQYYLDNKERLCATARERNKIRYDTDDIYRLQKIEKANERNRLSQKPTKVFTPEQREKRAEAKRNRYHNDEEYREKQKEYVKNWQKNNVELRRKNNEQKKEAYAFGKARHLANITNATLNVIN